VRQLFALLFVCLIPASVSAQERIDEAREAFQAGTEAYHAEHWLECAESFERSFQAIFAPELLFNVGLCYDNASNLLDDAEALPLIERAIAAYSRYLREIPTATDAVTIRARLYELHQLLESARRSTLADEEEDEVLNAAESESLAPEPEQAAVIPPPEAPPVAPNDFGFTWTLTGSALTLASFVAAVGLSLASQAEFDRLSASCGHSGSGCSEGSLGGLGGLVLASNLMYALSGILLAGTGLALGLEFHAWSTPAETRAGVQARFFF